MKLEHEHIFNDAVFLYPKMYGGITNHYGYVRSKGLKILINYEDLKKNSIPTSH